MERDVFSFAFAFRIFKSSIFAVSLLFSNPCTAQKYTVGVLKGPSSIPCVHLMENAAKYKNEQMLFQTYSEANLLVPKLIKGEAQLGFIPANIASKIYNKTKSVQFLAVTSCGMISLVTKDDSVKGFSDLNGKTISVAGHGATPDMLTRYFMKLHKIDSFLDYSVPNANIVPLLIGNKIQYAVIPEPFTTMALSKDKKTKKAIDYQKEFLESTGIEKYPMTILVANSKFARENRKIVKAFMDEYENALKKTISNPGETGMLAEKHNLGLNASVAEKSIPACNFVFKKADDETRKSMNKLLSIYLELDKTSVGGKLPDMGFYFE